MAERCNQATRGGITDGAGSSVGRVRAGSQLLWKRLVQTDARRKRQLREWNMVGDFASAERLCATVFRLGCIARWPFNY
jgi:hypothetical protein